MLYLYVGELDRDKIFGDDYYPLAPGYFDAVFEEEWMQNDFVKNIIRDIDKSTVIGPNLIISDVLGPIPPQTLAGSTKTLILLYFMDNFVTSGERLGDNCWKWVFEIAKHKDIYLPLYHTIPSAKLPNDMTCTIVNDDMRVFNGGGVDFFDNVWIPLRYETENGRKQYAKYKELLNKNSNKD